MAMNIGVCRIDLDMPDSRSLKDKRRTLRSIVDRMRSRFNVAIAEVDRNDSWQVATLGITCVSNYSSHANEMLNQVVSYVPACRGAGRLRSRDALRDVGSWLDEDYLPHY
jgi:uncharacterized protein YlxP (DUF503 family)